ncbi:bestrophin-2 [Caerostris extrusa]|uniref:Bestrophin homolog n=1 Tax=Caerostris extrusa TaxID=172846 RepID=A0AAV4Q290_CAEEX|nr:bestrophin-2 [Caerostris extrusa]
MRNAILLLAKVHGQLFLWVECRRKHRQSRSRVIFGRDDCQLPVRCGFFRLWRLHSPALSMEGSVWKVVYREMLIFTFCYIVLAILYNYALSEGQQRIFETVVYFCSTFMDLIPLSFMLGFYVSFIAARWWSQFIAIPWPDKLMNIVAMYIPGLDESSRVVRRTLMRYLNLSLVLVLRSISMAVKRRFPTKEHLIEAGFMTKTELEMFQSVPSTEFNTFWIPCTWFINVLREARQECRITDSNGLKLIMEELNEFRSKCGLLWGYDWISIPLVYTQVVTMATYAFFVACMFGRQNVKVIDDKPSSPEVNRYDFYVPIFTVLQLMFYMGLLKVAEQLINPFGDDDEDFELNWIIDRHMKVSYLGVDTLNGTPPPLVKDTYYDELDVKIPYTEASKSYKKKTYRGSVAYMQVPMEQQGMVLPDMSEEDDDGETQSEGMGIRRPSTFSLFQSRGSHCKGVSPAASFTNLDTRSITSVDSEWKLSLPDLSTLGAKNASGTLGFHEISPTIMDMDTAEDDEIVLQEVIVEQNNIKTPTVARSDSLQIPGTSGTPKKDIIRDTKDEDESENESLLNVSDHEPIEVAITLSSPELTETEKETGIHPYYFTQQTITSAKQLVTQRAFTVRQSSLTRSESEEDKISKGLIIKSTYLDVLVYQIFHDPTP